MAVADDIARSDRGDPLLRPLSPIRRRRICLSRLARNGRDWHTLIEFCGLVGTVIVDEDGIYDARHSNDRLLLGMNGMVT